MLGGILGPLRNDGVLDVDGFFLAFSPGDGPARYSFPLFHAVELTSDDIYLDVDPILLRSVSEALVMLTAPAYGAGFRDLHRAGLVPTEDVRDNLAQAAASTVAARHGGAQLVVVCIGGKGTHVVGQHVDFDVWWRKKDLGSCFQEREVFVERRN